MLCRYRTSAVRRAWQGSRAERLRGPRWVEWPTEGGQVVSSPVGVVASVSSRLERHYGLSAPEASDPRMPCAALDSSPVAAKTDAHRHEEICSSDAWNLLWRRRGEARCALGGAAHERLHGDFVCWATAPSARLPADWAESTVSFSPRASFAKTWRNAPSPPPVLVVGAAMRAMLAEHAPC